jgi:hypothetical protein
MAYLEFILNRYVDFYTTCIAQELGTPVNIIDSDFHGYILTHRPIPLPPIVHARFIVCKLVLFVNCSLNKNQSLIPLNVTKYALRARNTSFSIYETLIFVPF